MAGSVTEARSHDESRCGRNVIGVQGSTEGTEQNCNWGHENATSEQSSITGHGFMVY